MRIAFVSHKPHLNDLYTAISELESVQKVILYSRYPDRFHVLASNKLALKPIIVRTFGVRFILNWVLKTDFYSPNYIENLHAMLDKEQVTHLVVFDVFHWYVLQSFVYKTNNPKVRLYLWSETKTWPKSRASNFLARCFFTLIKRRLQYLERVLVYSEAGKKWWNEHAPKVDITVLPAPVDVSVFMAPANKQWLPDGALRILMNARYSTYKRHEDLLQAVVQLRKIKKRFHVTFIGRAGSGRSRVEKLVSQYQLDEFVTFLDPLPMSEMSALYQQHDVLVLPSYNEAIGMVVPEAMACGIPTITSDTVGANVYVKEKKTGWIHPTGDVGALAAALLECYDSAELARRGAAARTHVVAYYSVPIIAERFVSLLNE